MSLISLLFNPQFIQIHPYLMSLSHSFSGVYSAHDFLAEKRRKLGFNSDSIKKRQKQKDSKTYTEFLSEHERLMSRTGLRLKEDLHGLTGIDEILMRSLYPLFISLF